VSSAILGISAYYHDSAAAIVIDGNIIAAAQEERFTRKKHDSSFPINSVKYVLDEADIKFSDLEAVSFYEKPYIKFERLLESYHAFAPKGLLSFYTAIPLWIKEKLFMKKMLREEFKKLGYKEIPIFFPEHHLSHSASAFYPSPFREAAVLTIDGVGEWATTTIGYGKGSDLSKLRELHFPHSVGLLYSAFTYYTGFRVNSGEYKLMGLAPYGNPESSQTLEYKNLILNKLIDLQEDGSLLLNMKYFSFATGLRMCNDKKWQKLFGIPPRKPDSEIGSDYMNMALAIQQVTEEIVLRLARTAKKLTGLNNLVMAGGVALNSVANGKLLRSGLFKDIWIQPAAGDAGGAIGAAYLGWYLGKGNKRSVNIKPDSMNGAYLGPSYNDKQVKTIIEKFDASYKYISDFKELIRIVASDISNGKVIGWFQGRMEFGPRALGNRSILADARNPDIQKRLNLKIKYREGFRPFAPSVLEEDMDKFFEINSPSPYMLLVVPVNQQRLTPNNTRPKKTGIYDMLYQSRSDVPAITHIDNSARIQTVNKKTNLRYWELINEFKNQTGYGILVNTSFNVRGEPIVCNPEDAYRCFMNTDMDELVIGNYLFVKESNAGEIIDKNWKRKFKPD